MSWLANAICPICGADGFDPDCDQVDIGVGIQEGNLRGRCRVCGEVFQCEDCGKWEGEADPGHVCTFGERREVANEEKTELEELDVKLTVPKGVAEAVLRGEISGISLPGRRPIRREPEVSVEAVEGVLAELGKLMNLLPGVRAGRTAVEMLRPTDAGRAHCARNAYALARRVVSMGLLGREPPEYEPEPDELRRMILETDADLAALAALGRGRDDFEMIRRQNELERLRRRLAELER